MGIDVSHLIINPNIFINNRKKSAVVSYSGLVDADSDNPVKVTFLIPDDASPVYLLDDLNQKVKSISFEKSFKIGTDDSYSDSVRISVDRSDDGFTPCEINLIASTTTDEESEAISSLYYK